MERLDALRAKIKNKNILPPESGPDSAKNRRFPQEMPVRTAPGSPPGEGGQEQNQKSCKAQLGKSQLPQKGQLLLGRDQNESHRPNIGCTERGSPGQPLCSRLLEGATPRDEGHAKQLAVDPDPQFIPGGVDLV